MSLNTDDLDFFESRGFGKKVGFGKNSALLVIDAIKGFTNPDMPMGSDVSNELQVIKMLVDLYHKRNRPIIFTTISYDEEDAKDGGVWVEKMEGLKTLMSHTQHVEVDSSINVQQGDILLEKKYASAFFGTDLVSRLNSREIDTLVLTGFTTSGCIRATAVDGVSYGFRIIVAEDAVSDRSELSHEQSLFDIEQKYGDVMTSKEVIQTIGQ